MKKIIVCLLTLAVLAGCAQTAPNVTPVETAKPANYTDEMKIEKAVDLEEYGADSVERAGDHEGTPYFTQLDFYNMESTDTLTILPKFKTYQQTSEWSCGVVSALMVLDYYGKLGDFNEETLSEFRTNGLAYEATSLESMIKIFEGVSGFELDSTYNYTEENFDDISLEMIQDSLKNNVPVMVAWNDWGGHWQVIIGYDTMGTETQQDDVIIVADSYDTTDHNQDGYGVYSAERFFYNWTMYDFFSENYGINERDRLFITAKPLA
ncbi:MAG: C39 family peptidase [Anaerorhabdus sp.]|jgi:hypothetical protein